MICSKHFGLCDFLARPVSTNESTSVSFVWSSLIPIYDDFGEISKAVVDELLEDWLSFTFNRWIWINLNHPHIKIIINHKIIAEKLKAIFSVVNLVLYWLTWGLDLCKNLRLDVFFVDVLTKSLTISSFNIIRELCIRHYIIKLFFVIIIFTRFFICVLGFVIILLPIFLRMEILDDKENDFLNLEY